MALVILYRRISVSRGDSESLEAQHARLTAWARREGHEIIADFYDDGISGKNLADRPGALAAISLACKTRGSILATVSLSRLGRSVRDVVSSCEQLAKAGANFVSLAENVDLSTSSGRFLVAVISACAQLEREQIVSRTVQMMAHLRRKNKRISRYAPFGWDVDPDGTMLVENAAEQAVIAQMHTLCAAGQSYNAIARHLSEHDVHAKLGGAWSGRAVRLVLVREAKLASVA